MACTYSPNAEEWDEHLERFRVERERELHAAILQEFAVVATGRALGVLGVDVNTAWCEAGYFDLSVVVKLKPWAARFFWPDLVRAHFERLLARSTLRNETAVLGFVVLS